MEIVQPSTYDDDTSYVVGPSSAVNSDIAVFDGTTGKLIKDGGVTIASLQLWDRSGTTLSPHTAGDNISTTGSITGNSLIKSGGTSSQFLKADGSVDSSTYLTSLTPWTSNINAANFGINNLNYLQGTPYTLSAPASITASPNYWLAGTPTTPYDNGSYGDSSGGNLYSAITYFIWEYVTVAGITYYAGPGVITVDTPDVYPFTAIFNWAGSGGGFIVQKTDPVTGNTSWDDFGGATSSVDAGGSDFTHPGDAPITGYYGLYAGGGGNTYTVWAYKLEAGVILFSPPTTTSFIDDGSGNSFNSSVSWSAVTGAIGYVVSGVGGWFITTGTSYVDTYGISNTGAIDTTLQSYIPLDFKESRLLNVYSIGNSTQDIITGGTGSSQGQDSGSYNSQQNIIVRAYKFNAVGGKVYSNPFTVYSDPTIPDTNYGINWSWTTSTYDTVIGYVVYSPTFNAYVFTTAKSLSDDGTGTAFTSAGVPVTPLGDFINTFTIETPTIHNLTGTGTTTLGTTSTNNFSSTGSFTANTSSSICNFLAPDNPGGIFWQVKGAQYGNNFLSLGYENVGGAYIAIRYGGSGSNTKMFVDNIIIAKGVTMPYLARTSAITLDAYEYTINCTANSFTVTLPSAVTYSGQTYNIKNSGTGTITINTTSSQTIDGVTTYKLAPGIPGSYPSVTLQSDGANWIIISKITSNPPLGYRAITSATTILPTDHYIEVTSGTFTQPLPSASGIAGTPYVIKNTGTGIVTVSCAGAETIDGYTTMTLSVPNSVIKVFSNGTNWLIESSS